LGLDDAGEDALITKWYAEQPEREQALRRALDRSRRLRSLATNPLFLSVLLTGYDSNPERPVRCTALYEGLLRILSRQEEASQLAPTLKEQVLQELALELHTRQTQSLPKRELLARMHALLAGSGQTADGVDRLLDELVSDNILWPGSEGTYSFAHLAWQEYLAAKELFVRGDLETIAGHVDDPWYEQVFVLMAGLQRKAYELIGLIRERSQNPQRALFLAARCLAEADQTDGHLKAEIAGELFDLFRQEAPELWADAAVALAGPEDQSVEAALLRALEAQDPKLRQNAAWALGRVGKEWAVARLISALEDPRPEGRQRVAWALGQIRDKRAIYPLIRVFNDHKSSVAEEAAQAVANIGQSAVEPLIHTLNAPEEQARKMAIIALSRIGTPAVDLLIKTLGDQDEKVYRSVIEILVRIGEPAIESLRSTVRGKKTVITKGAAEALGRIGSERAAKALIELLATADPVAREDIISALVVVGKPAVKPLIGVLGDERGEVRKGAAQALRKAGDLAIEDLIEVLGDARWKARTEAAEVVEQFGVSAAKHLIAALDSAKPELRLNATELLRRLGDEEAVEPLIARLKEDEEAAVRLKAVEALGQIGDKRALRSLIDSLRDPDANVRGKAAEVLGRIGDKRAIKPLIQTLTDRENVVRVSAATGLRQLGELAVEPLIVALYDHTLDSNAQIAVRILGEIGAGEPEPQSGSLIGLAKIYHELLSYDKSFEQAIRSSSQLRWWKYGPELYESFRTADDFRRYKTLQEIAESEDRLHWMIEITTWLRPEIRGLFLELSGISRDVRESLSSSNKENRRDALRSARRRLDLLRDLDRKLLEPECSLFAMVIESWYDAIVKTMKRWGFGADLELKLQTRRVRYRDSRPATCVLLVKNTGVSPARNLYIGLKPGREGELEIDKSAGHQIPQLPSGERSLEFSIRPLRVGEVELRFEAQYDDESGEAYRDEYRCSIDVFLETKEYKPITKNPYNPSVPVAGKEGFYGRSRHLEELRQMTKDMHDTPAVSGFIHVIGLRRIGKTSLLYRLRDELSSEGYVCPFVDIQWLSSQPDATGVFYGIARDIFKCLKDQGLPVDPPEWDGYKANPWSSFLDLRGKLAIASDAKPIILMLDEFDTMFKLVRDKKVDQRVFDYFRSWMQHSGRIVCIVVGTPEMRRQYEEHESDLFMNAIPYWLPPFAKTDAEKMITEPMRGELEYDQRAIDKIVDLTAGHPYFIAHMCRGLIQLAREHETNNLDLSDVNEYVPDSIGAVEEALKHYTRNLPIKARIVIAAIAESTTEHSLWASQLELYKTLERMGVSISRDELLNTLQELQDYALVEIGGERLLPLYRVQFPLYSMWLRQTRELQKL